MQGFLEVFAFWGEPGIFLLKIIICIKSGNLLGNIFFGGGSSYFFYGGGGDSYPKQASRKLWLWDNHMECTQEVTLPLVNTCE